MRLRRSAAAGAYSNRRFTQAYCRQEGQHPASTTSAGIQRGVDGVRQAGRGIRLLFRHGAVNCPAWIRSRHRARVLAMKPAAHIGEMPRPIISTAEPLSAPERRSHQS